MIHTHRDSLGRFVLSFSFNKNLGAYIGHLRFVVFFFDLKFKIKVFRKKKQKTKKVIHAQKFI